MFLQHPIPLIQHRLHQIRLLIPSVIQNNPQRSAHVQGRHCNVVTKGRASEHIVVPVAMDDSRTFPAASHFGFRTKSKISNIFLKPLKSHHARQLIRPDVAAMNEHIRNAQGTKRLVICDGLDVRVIVFWTID